MFIFWFGLASNQSPLFAKAIPCLSGCEEGDLPLRVGRVGFSLLAQAMSTRCIRCYWPPQTSMTGGWWRTAAMPTRSPSGAPGNALPLAGNYRERGKFGVGARCSSSFVGTPLKEQNVPRYSQNLFWSWFVCFFRVFFSVSPNGGRAIHSDFF